MKPLSELFSLRKSLSLYEDSHHIGFLKDFDKAILEFIAQKTRVNYLDFEQESYFKDVRRDKLVESLRRLRTEGLVKKRQLSGDKRITYFSLKDW